MATEPNTASDMVRTAQLASIEAFTRYRETLIDTLDSNAPRILVCCGTGCKAIGSLNLLASMKAAVEKAGADIRVMPEIKRTGCHGFCSRGPLLTILPQNLFYQRVKPEDAEEIVQKTILGGEIIPRFLFKPKDSKESIEKVSDIPFFARQTKLVLKRVGKIDPFDIQDAIANGAYEALAYVLKETTPQQVIEEIKVSKLRGRGGAGFPTGIKWESCAKQSGRHYVICNGDEGDPGAFMDASVMEGDPHAVLEGMAIAAYAIGSDRGFLYVRMEYPLAVQTLSNAIRQAEDMGLLGLNILGTGFNFRVSVSTGAGAFVCGESSALMSSLEGKVGRPRAKYIRSTEKGFRDSPSNLNNVETYANIPEIILRGGQWYTTFGTERSAGTKVFSLTGNVNNVGLVEVPMGTSLREIVFNIGGGIPNKKQLKAVQTGGPSGGCIPIPGRFIDINVGFGKLAEIGSMMGSGGMIVMDENTCMVEVSRYFINFLVEESCGQCTPCREGLTHMRQILTRITEGNGREGDIELLEEIGTYTNSFSLCGLGTSAANPVLSTIKYFREEYESHIRDKKCPAGVCKTLFYYEILPETCTGCGVCKKRCPAKAISGEKKKPHTIHQDLCIKCMECYKGCKFDAIRIL
ncbi:MAG TPA: NADH-ubiquinone oxidoreductase-F iron-sulfur binding region domain-containing protein [Desulfatirhabdiaceae bacterium]|nr:NADH-ubiquinone oxidoreductase-F iron-sulfur binding region domain-containing protein [Desulfatirhabdiaceae bacterium]